MFNINLCKDMSKLELEDNIPYGYNNIQVVHVWIQFLIGFLMLLPILIVVAIGILWRLENLKISGLFTKDYFDSSVMISFLLTIVHEFLHAVCYPLPSKKYIFFDVKKLCAFTYCNASLLKFRYILMLIMPSVIIGIAPIIVWFLGIWSYNKVTSILLMTGIINLLMSASDYYKLYRIIIVTPHNSYITVLSSGLYWYKK